MSEEPGKLFVGGVHSQVTKEEFQSFFNDKFGEVIDAVLMFDVETKKSRGFGFITFKNQDHAAEVLKTGPHSMNGKQIDCKPSVRRGDAPPSKRPNLSTNQDNYKKVFVGGIAQGTTKEGLKNFFISAGFFVTEVVLMLDTQTKKSRGFAFVTFADDAAVEKVCNDRFFNIDGKTVECKRAEPRGNGAGGGGGGGGGMNQRNMMGGGGPMGGSPMGGGPMGGGPMRGGGGGWNQNPGYANNQFNQGGGGPTGNYGQENFNQPSQQQQQPYGPNRPANQGNFGAAGQYNQGSYGQQQQQPQHPQQQQPYGAGYQQPQQPQQPPPQQPQHAPQQQGSYGQPQNYNYSYQQQQQQQQLPQQQPPNQPNQYSNQSPQQPASQQYNTGNMGNYPHEASGYGPQRGNYSATAQPANFNPQQGGGSGYTNDMNGGYQQQPPQPQASVPSQPQQQPQQPLQQQPPPQQQPQQPYQQPQQHTENTPDNMYAGGNAPAGNYSRAGSNAPVNFHPYRR